VSVTTYQGWVNDGKPWHDCQPTKDLVAMLRRHGYTGPGVGIGNQTHLTANPPEDHTPYSHTPWPGAQPYPAVMALDIMPNNGIDTIALGGILFADKQAGKPGTEPIKYINWTDPAGNCWHDSWMPNHARYSSTDRGHIHVSFRTDFATSTAMAGYDPLTQGGTSMLCNFGDKGPIVQALQMLLLKVSPVCLPKFGPDGDYGQETADAVSILVSGGPGRTYGPAEYATLAVLVAQHAATPPAPAAQLVPHIHSLSLATTGPAEATP
jgi:hypothetical protein